MNIIVIGANGGVGKHVVAKALKDGHQVTAFLRDPNKLDIEHANLRKVQGDGLNESEVTSAMAGHDAVICTVGGRGLKESTLQSTVTKNIIQAMNKHQIKKVVYCASAGIHKELKGLGGKFVMYLLRKVLVDHARAYGLLAASSLDWVVVRPMGLKDEENTDYRIFGHMLPPEKSAISRKAVASFIVDATVNDRYNKQSIGLSY